MNLIESDSENRFNQKFKCRFPDLFHKIVTIDSLNYLNLIDRSFYVIRIREEFYNNYKDILGEEIDPELQDENLPEEPIQLETLESKLNYTFEKYIFQIDNILLERINQNNRRIRIFHNLDSDITSDALIFLKSL